MPSLSDLTDIDLDKRVRELTRELATLKRLAAKRGTAALDEAGETASDIYGAVAERLVASLPSLRKRAKALEKQAYDHPATVAAVGLVVIGLAASLLLRRR